jgi:pimeloyl-ACP methyl ester carboxylesterase
MNGFLSGAFSDDAMRACLDALGKVADLRLYSTPIAVEDLDEVREALGYERINLYGGSYGSTAAMAYMRQYPKRVRTATLLGVAPPDLRLPLPFAKGVQNAIDHLAADCAADARCHAAYPDPKADFAAAAARLDKRPATVEAVNPITGKTQTVALSRAGFVDAVRLMLYQPEATRWLPLLLHRSASGDFGAFVTVSFQTYRALDDQIARGMHLSVLCGEDLPFVTDADAARETAGTVYGDGRLAAYRRACGIWPRADVPASYATPVASDAPVLLVVGEADPVTPPWIAEAAARRLPNGRVVVVAHTGHAFAFPCVDDLVAAFVAKGSVKNLDASCAAGVARPPFLTEELVAAYGKPPATAKPQEVWEGVLDVGAAKLRLVLKISKADDGALSAVIDSPDQGAANLPIDAITRTGSALHFEMAVINASYDGTTSADGSEIAGEWKQGGRSWPLVFRRAMGEVR